MRNRGLPQEGLKLIACVSMLIDHFAAVLLFALFPVSNFLFDLYGILRIVGRFAFPIYCFLLVEGAAHTRNPKRYALRLLIGAALAEIPFDLAIFGGFTWQHQSVMVTLLLGFGALEGMKRCPQVWQKLLMTIPFALAADYLHTDYGAAGVALVVLFAMTRDMPHKRLIQFFGMWFLFSDNHAMLLNWILKVFQMGTFYLTTQEWAVLSIVPISLYDGSKITKSKAVQWAFYLFYPAHLTALYLIGGI